MDLSLALTVVMLGFGIVLLGATVFLVYTFQKHHTKHAQELITAIRGLRSELILARALPEAERVAMAPGALQANEAREALAYVAGQAWPSNDDAAEFGDRLSDTDASSLDADARPSGSINVHDIAKLLRNPGDTEDDPLLPQAVKNLLATQTNPDLEDFAREYNRLLDEENTKEDAADARLREIDHAVLAGKPDPEPEGD